MDIREKLVELISCTPCVGYSSRTAVEHIADWLISNGVTEQEVLTVAEYIEREEIRGAYEKLTRSYVNDDPYIADWRFDEMIENLPASDVAPVRHGRWDIDGVYVVCSVCNRLTLSPIVKQLPTFKYCPNCGARMDGERKDGNRDA